MSSCGQVVVDGDGCGRAWPAAVMTWARGSMALPAPQTPATLVRPVVSTTAKPAASRSQPSLARRSSAVRRDVGPDEHCGAGHDLAVGELDAGEAVVLDDESGDFAVNDADAAGVELGGFGRGRFLGVGEVDDVVGPLADQLRVEDRAGVGADDPEGLVADLPAVAVRAVEEVASPALADTGYVGDVVGDTRGDEEPPGGEGLGRRRGGR